MERSGRKNRREVNNVTGHIMRLQECGKRDLSERDQNGSYVRMYKCTPYLCTCVDFAASDFTLCIGQ